MLCTSVVFIVQCLLFADGGITALGTNIVLMGVVTVAVGWFVFRALQSVLPKTRRWCRSRPASGRSSSVPVASLVFVGLYAVGGAADIPLGTPDQRHGRRPRAHRHR